MFYSTVQPAYLQSYKDPTHNISGAHREGFFYFDKGLLLLHSFFGFCYKTLLEKIKLSSLVYKISPSVVPIFCGSPKSSA